MSYTLKKSPNLSAQVTHSTAAQRDKAPAEVRGRGNRGAWAAGFTAGASGQQANCPYAVAGPTVTLRRSWLQGWETGAKSRFESKGKKEPSNSTGI